MSQPVSQRAPHVGTITRTVGVAGQVMYAATVTYPYEGARRVAFVGNLDGGPVVMVTQATPEGVFVTEPSRFGEFGRGWVRRFFEEVRGE